MKIATSYSSTKVHPATLKQCKAIVFEFDTGHVMTRYEGGAEFFNNKSGRALNPVSGANLVQQMRLLSKSLA